MLGENAISLEEVAVRPSKHEGEKRLDAISSRDYSVNMGVLMERTCEKLTETRPRRNGNNTVDGQAIFGF